MIVRVGSVLVGVAAGADAKLVVGKNVCMGVAETLLLPFVLHLAMFLYCLPKAAWLHACDVEEIPLVPIQVLVTGALHS